MCALLAALIKNTRGATAIEYGLIAALVALAATNVMGTVGKNLSMTFNTVSTHLATRGGAGMIVSGLAFKMRGAL
jgi:pilus assembly protein Flp/PilA